MTRLDVLLVGTGRFESREKAQLAIESGAVKVNGALIQKPGKAVDGKSRIEVDESLVLPYVSLGGLKLKKAIDEFCLGFNGCMVLDIGASTGGFTDCALQHGAAFVWAVDVGTSQLHPKLQNHPKVISLEQTDFRELSPDKLEGKLADYILTDVSFISLSHFFALFHRFLQPGGSIITLIKPQFEAGRNYLNRHGIVTSPYVHQDVIRSQCDLAMKQGFYMKKLTWAPITSRGKNIEYLALYHTVPTAGPDIKDIINSAFLKWKEKSG